MSKQSFARTLTQTSGDAIEVCRLAASGTTGHGFDLAVVDTATNLTLQYRIDVAHNGTAGAWKRLVPNKTIVPSKFTSINRTWAMDVSIATNQATLRVVRTKDTAANTSVKCVVAAYGRTGETVTITGLTGTASGVTNAGTYEGTMLAELDNRLGVNTDTPNFTLDIAGDLNASTGNVFRIGGTTVLSSTALGTTITSAPGLTSVGTLGALQVTGLIEAGNLTVGGTSFSDLVGSSIISQTISDGVTTTAPSENAVFDALALKANASAVYTKTQLDEGQLDNRYFTETEVTTFLAAKANVANAVFTGTTTTAALSASALTVSGNINLTGLGSSITGNAVYVDVATGKLSFGRVEGGGNVLTDLTVSSTANLNVVTANVLTVGGNSIANIARTAVVSQTITDNVTTTAPSENAVFDALSLKSNAADVYTKTQLDAGQLDTRYYTESETNTLLNAKENVITASTTGTYFRGDKTFQTLDTTAVVEGANLYFTNARAQTALTTQLDAKANVANTVFTGITTASQLSVTGNLTVSGNIHLTGLGSSVTGNAVYIDASTGQLSYGKSTADTATLDETTLTSVAVFQEDVNGFTFDNVVPSQYIFKWTSRTSAADNQWRSVTWGNGLFVAVASSGTGDRVMTSPDGITWTSRTSAADNSWSSVTWGNGLFVAVSTSGTGNRVMTSPDGITWTLRTSAADNFWNSVTYGNGLFVAVSLDGSGNRVMTSPDGITWTLRTSAADNFWTSVTYGNGLFVAVSNTGTGNRVMTSPDGITWTLRTSAADNSWQSVTWGNGLFVAVSTSGTGNRVMTSPDGITWTLRNSAADFLWGSVTYGNGLFVAVSYDGTGKRVMTWDPNTTTITPNVSGVMYYSSDTGLVSYGPIASVDVSSLYAVTANLTTLNLDTLNVSGNAQIGNVSATAMSVSTLSATSNATLANVSVTGLSINNTAWASYVVHGTTTAFTYTGPGTSLSNGVPFYAQTQSNGTAFVTPSGTNNSIFTFATSGVYMLQSEIDAGFPFFPTAVLTTYYIRNGNTAVQFGKESHSPDSFSCTRPYLFTASASDNVRFIIESAAGNEYEVGLNATRLTILKLV